MVYKKIKLEKRVCMNLVEHGCHLALALGLSLALTVQVLTGFVELSLEGLGFSVARSEVLLQLLDLGLGLEVGVLGVGEASSEVAELGVQRRGLGGFLRAGLTLTVSLLTGKTSLLLGLLLAALSLGNGTLMVLGIHAGLIGSSLEIAGLLLDGVLVLLQGLVLRAKVLSVSN